MSYSFPREILKWLQSMDLSVSVQNIRRDFANGFIYAETISKYHPGFVPMHTFENSHKTYYKEDNWKQLELVFAKLKLDFKTEEFKHIKDYDMNQTVEFTLKLYTRLTNRNLELRKRIQISEASEKTKTLLLTETGLDNIDLKEKRMAIMAELEDQETEFNHADSYDEELNNMKNKTDPDDSSNMLVSRSELNKMLEGPNEHIKESQKSIISGKFNSTAKAMTFVIKTKQRLVVDQKIDSKTQKSKLNEILEINHIGYRSINERLNDLLRRINNNYDNECFIVIAEDESSYYNFSNVVNSFSDQFLRAFQFELSGLVI